MKLLLEQNRVGGLLAFQGNECVGWLSVDPMSQLIGHDCQSSGKVDEWSIHCIFVKNGFRGQGISTKLILAAVRFAKANGAKIISAFPIPDQNRVHFPSDKAEFSGRFSTYVKVGFITVGVLSEFYQRMEIE